MSGKPPSPLRQSDNLRRTYKLPGPEHHHDYHDDYHDD